MLRRWLLQLGAAAVVLSPWAPAQAQAKPSIILATTTSTQDSGLLDMLVPRFENERGIDVKVIAVGTGAALRMAASGDADVVFVHAPEAERKSVDAATS
jgi:tungstate transport system substrate-binding protein